MNYETGEWYVETGEYYYEFATPFYASSKGSLLESKELLNKAKAKLQAIQYKSQYPFFEKEILNRIEQVDMFLIIIDNLYSIVDYSQLELYEINYGSKLKADEYYEKHTSLIPTYNLNMEKLSEISNEIDLEWEQDWYPTFQESEAY